MDASDGNRDVDGIAMLDEDDGGWLDDNGVLDDDDDDYELA